MADNVIKSITESRKTIFVISNASALSPMCQFELAAANHHLVAEDKNSLILLIKEDVRAANMTPLLAFLMKNKTYIEWVYGEKAERWFYSKRRALQKPSTSFKGNPVKRRKRSASILLQAADETEVLLNTEETEV